MITCTFAGHRNLVGDVTEQIEEVLEQFLQKEDTLHCYVGNMGMFDSFAAAAVYAMKKKYPEKTIRLMLVLPYMQQKVKMNLSFYKTYYDDVFIPLEVQGLHYKQAIPARNKWMVNHADCLIAMVWRPFGGAYQTLCYAQKCGKQIIALPQPEYEEE